MTEDPTSSGVPADELSEEQVSRLLAEAADASDPGPVPPDVATRLDAVLADLVAERGAETERTEDGPSSGTGQAAPVVPIDATRERRRRTWAPRLLVAAVVLGVAGVGVSVLDDLGAGSDDSASAGSAADSEASSEQSSEAGTEAGGRAEGGNSADSDSGDRDDSPAPLRSSESAADSLRADLRITDAASLRSAVLAVGARDLALGSADGARKNGQEPRRGVLESRVATQELCVAPAGPGRRSLVTYRGSPATLVVRRDGDRLDGRVYDCALGLQLDGVEIGPAGE